LRHLRQKTLELMLMIERDLNIFPCKHRAFESYSTKRTNRILSLFLNVSRTAFNAILAASLIDTGTPQCSSASWRDLR
jgi:hypothetical protein